MINFGMGGGVDGGKVVVNGQVFDFGAIVNGAITFPHHSCGCSSLRVCSPDEQVQRTFLATEAEEEIAEEVQFATRNSRFPWRHVVGLTPLARAAVA